MKHQRVFLLLAALSIGAAGLSCSKITPKDLEGKQVDVMFSKGFYVSYLTRPSYRNLTVVKFTPTRACFKDQSQKFNKENLGDNLKQTIASTKPRIGIVELVENRDGTFCVPRRSISSIAINGKKVWGSGRAEGTR